jgi:hypothetical protein
MPPMTWICNNHPCKFINYFNNYYHNESNVLNTYIEHSKYIVNKHGGFENHSEVWIKMANDSFNFICKEGEDKLIHLMLMKDKKLKCYDNLLKLYPEPNYEKPEIKNIMDMNPENPEIVNLIDLFAGV